MRPDLHDDEQFEREQRRRGINRGMDRPMDAPDAPLPPLHPDDVLYRPGVASADDLGYRGEPEETCERCGAELPARARFCAACGHSIEPSKVSQAFGRIESRFSRIMSPDGELARSYGLTRASMVALAIALFCVVFAVLVQLTIPNSSPSYSPAELYQVYTARTVLWLMGAVVALVAALVFKRNRGSY